MSSPLTPTPPGSDQNLPGLVGRLEKKISDLRWWILFLAFMNSVLYAMLLYVIIVIH